MATEISLKDLLEAGSHFGHQSKRWNPKMKPYLYGVRDGIHIFDLVKTKEGLDSALAFVHKAAAEGKIIAFVGTKRQAEAIVTEDAKKIGVPYISHRWMGGIITNWEQLKKSIDRLLSLTEKREKGELKKYTKREQLLFDREIMKLERFFGGLKELKQPPDILFIVDVKKEDSAVREAKRKGLPVVGIVDTNSDPDLIDYVIPANDDAIGSIKLIVDAVANAVGEGKAAYEKGIEKEKAKEKTKKKA